MPTKAENAKQTARDCSGLGNDCATYLDVIELELEIGAIGLTPEEVQPHDEIVDAAGRPGRDGDHYNASGGGRQCSQGARYSSKS